ncbi:hypothetical protein [Natrarchaeobaculum aegyptiacum]|uniref:Uncharacterized protein n=1 Tax=Natrarchaeobaculum aegyptiacum TaxID=745377 RepID=A0A2Z2HUX8_9EURY|nr:hypothetical protein [Natrarchaeobaculum aegyptiacum]ARS89965.1 hypothetical protein B1756_09640 [Natrarchaeobaculum aegyptiacum]
MVEKTPNHGLHTYEQGETDWTHTPDMETIEERLVVRAPESERDEYEPHPAATFVAIDTGAVYDGNGSTWFRATRRYETTRAEETTTESFVAEDALAIPTYESRDAMESAIDDPGSYLGLVDGSLEVVTIEDQ